MDLAIFSRFFLTRSPCCLNCFTSILNWSYRVIFATVSSRTAAPSGSGIPLREATRTAIHGILLEMQEDNKPPDTPPIYVGPRLSEFSLYSDALLLTSS